MKATPRPFPRRFKKPVELIGACIDALRDLPPEDRERMIAGWFAVVLAEAVLDPLAGPGSITLINEALATHARAEGHEVIWQLNPFPPSFLDMIEVEAIEARPVPLGEAMH
jgi:hypothetical protein